MALLDRRTKNGFVQPFTYWWAHPDSNQGPTGYEPAALPLSYGPEVYLVYCKRN